MLKNAAGKENHMTHKIINAISSRNVPCWGSRKKYIAVHYLGVAGQAHDLASDGCGAHFYIYWDGTIYQRCSLDAVPWAVGTAGYYTQKPGTAILSALKCAASATGTRPARRIRDGTLRKRHRRRVRGWWRSSAMNRASHPQIAPLRYRK